MKKFVFPAAFAMAIVSALAFKPVQPMDTQYYRIVPNGNPVCDLSNCQPSGTEPCEHTAFQVKPGDPSQDCSEPITTLKKP